MDIENTIKKFATIEIFILIVISVLLAVMAFSGLDVDQFNAGFGGVEFLQNVPIESEVTIGNQASTEVLAASGGRLRAELYNVTGTSSPETFWCSVGAAAVVNQGFFLTPTSTPEFSKYVIDGSNLVTRAINCITESSTTTINVIQW